VSDYACMFGCCGSVGVGEGVFVVCALVVCAWVSCGLVVC
jgi:hypothetical protein